MKKFFIVLVATALVVAFTLPASAQTEFTLYGSVHMDTMVTDTDNTGTTRDTSPLTWDLSTGNWSSFGARIKVDEKLSGTIEWRSRPGGYLADNLAQSAWTGAYNMGFATLRLGRWWTPSFNPPPAWMVDTVGSPIVTVQEPRIALENIKLGPVSFQVTAMRGSGNPGGLYNATFIAPVAENIAAGQPAVSSPTQTESTMPRFEARADAKFGPVSIAVLGGYYDYDYYSNNTSTATKIDISSNFYGAIGTFNMGPFQGRGSWIHITNPDHYAPGPAGPARVTTMLDANNNVIDVDRTIWQVYGTYTLNPMISFNLIYGQSHYEQDVAVGRTDEDDQSGWAFTVPINITQNFTIRLEYSKLDNEDRFINNARTNESEVTKYGARWIFFF